MKQSNESAESICLECLSQYGWLRQVVVYLIMIQAFLFFSSVSFSMKPNSGLELAELLVVLHHNQEMEIWPNKILNFRKIPGSRIYRVWLAKKHVSSIVSSLQNKTEVEHVEQASRLSAHRGLRPGFEGSSFSELIPDPPLWWLKDIDAQDFAILGKGQGEVVAVLDTGLDLSSNAFNRQIWRNPDEIAYDSHDNDGNGYVDDVLGWNFGEQSHDVQDELGHGTRVASIIKSIAPDVALLPLKVNKSRESTFSIGNVVEAIYYAVQAKADVVNMSFSGSEYSFSLDCALQEASLAGCVLVAPAGNSGQGVEFPANLQDVIAVASMDKAGGHAEFSSLGSEVDIMAPGEDIWCFGLGQKMSYATGTSFSTAMVSATAAVVMSRNSQLRPESVKKILTSNHSIFGLTCDTPRLSGKISLANMSPRLYITLTSLIVRNLKNEVWLNLELPPTDTPCDFVFSVLHERNWLCLKPSQELVQPVANNIPSLISLPAIEDISIIPLFGPRGLLPPMEWNSLDSGTYEVFLGLFDKQGRLISPPRSTHFKLSLSKAREKNLRFFPVY